MHLCSLYCRRCWSADIPYCGLHESLNRHPNVLFSMACSCMSLPLSLSFTFTAPQNFSFLTFCPAPYCVSQQCNRAERAPSCVDLRRALQSAWWRCMGYPELHGAMQPRAGWKNPQPRMVLCQKVRPTQRALLRERWVAWGCWWRKAAKLRGAKSRWHS